VPTSSVWLGFCYAISLAWIKRASMKARSGAEMPHQLTSAAELFALAGELYQAGPAALVCLPPEW